MPDSAAPAERWLEQFAAVPLEAIDKFLLGGVPLGRFERSAPDEFLFRTFVDRTDLIGELDRSLHAWFKQRCGALPPLVSGARWVDVLAAALRTVPRLPLRRTHSWLNDHVEDVRTWLTGLYLDPVRDPEAEFLRTLALIQRDQRHLSLWFRLCRLIEDRPPYYFEYGLLGLQKLPNPDGTAPGDLPDPFFSGVSDSIEAIYEQLGAPAEVLRIWRLRIRSVMAQYPRSSVYWYNHLKPYLGEKQRAWDELGSIIPALKRSLTHSPSYQQWVTPPTMQERKDMLARVGRVPLESIRGELSLFLDRYRYYTSKTGDSEYLVKTFSSLAARITDVDPEWALSLLDEALAWQPSNPVLWSEQAKAELALGRMHRSAALLWEARRRFPEHAPLRTQLAELLKEQGARDIAELMYRQAVQEFPEHAPALVGLGNLLRENREFTEARALFARAVDEFDKNPYALNGLATLALAERNWEEAEQLYRRGLILYPENKHFKAGLRAVADARREADSHRPSTSFDTPNTEVNTVRYDRKADDVLAESTREWLDRLLLSSEANTQALLSGASFLRQAKRYANAPERSELLELLRVVWETVLDREPDAAAIQLERSFMLLETAGEEAVEYFESRAERLRHVLGFRVGALLAKAQGGARPSLDTWDEVRRDFPNRATVVVLACAQDALERPNGVTAPALDRLRVELHRPLERIPEALRENERWLRAMITSRVFDGIHLNGDQVDEPVVARARDNFMRHHGTVRNVLEQSLLRT